MTKPLILAPSIIEEGHAALLAGQRVAQYAHEYRFGFCFVPEAYKVGSTERANFLQGCCYASFGAPA